MSESPLSRVSSSVSPRVGFSLAWRLYGIFSWVVCLGFLWMLFARRMFGMRELILLVLTYGLAVGLAAVLLRQFELLFRRQEIAVLEGARERANRAWMWGGLFASLGILLGATFFVWTVAKQLKQVDELRAQMVVSSRTSAGRHVRVPLLEATPEQLEAVRATIETALQKLDASLKVVDFKITGASFDENHLYSVAITYNTPLYAVGTPFTKWHDKARGLTFPVRGGAWREVTLVAEAGTPVPSTLFWISSGHWRLQAETSPETAFAPYLLKRYADAALVLQGSEADKALRKALGRVLDIQAQAEADRTARRGDPMAAARLKQAEATLKFASATFGTFFRAHAGRWVEQIPETLFETLGTLPKASATKAQATVDTNQLIKEANRRLVIAGHTAKLTAAEVVEHVETEQANVYRLRVKFDQPTYTLGERNSSWGNQNNRAVRLSGLPTWRLVTLRHPSGDTIEINLRMAKPNTRKPDAIALDERGIPGLAFPDDIRARGQTDLLPLVGSSAQKSWENMLEHALTLSQAIYEDAKLRRNDHAAKTRYETNRKALATFQKALKSYAKEQVGKVAEVFPELPSPPKPCQ